MQRSPLHERAIRLVLPSKNAKGPHGTSQTFDNAVEERKAYGSCGAHRSYCSSHGIEIDDSVYATTAAQAQRRCSPRQGRGPHSSSTRPRRPPNHGTRAGMCTHWRHCEAVRCTQCREDDVREELGRYHRSCEEGYLGSTVRSPLGFFWDREWPSTTDYWLQQI